MSIINGSTVRSWPDKLRFAFYCFNGLVGGVLGYGFIWINQTWDGRWILPPEIGGFMGLIVMWAYNAFVEWGRL